MACHGVDLLPVSNPVKIIKFVGTALKSGVYDEMKAITKLRESIESRLAWGSADDWSNYDFEKLSEEIFKITGVNLSVSTLKRFFGKVKYGSSPSVTTLNTLARFLGFEDWRDFESKEELQTESKSESKKLQPAKAKSLVPRRLYIFSGVILLFIVA